MALGAIKTRLTILALTVVMSVCVGANRPEVRGLDSPDALVLRVRVVSVEQTDFYRPEDECQVAPDSNSDVQCIHMYLWHKYKANVLSVVKGKWEGRVVEFANYQHSKYQRNLLEDCYIVLVKASAKFEGQVGVSYVSQDIVLPRLSSDRARVRTLLSHGT